MARAALADVLYEPFAAREAARLEQLRLAALEERIDADLALGRASEVIPELERLVRDEPVSRMPLLLHERERARTVESAGAELLDVLVELSSHHRHLGLRQAGDAEGLHELVHPAGRDPEQVAGRHHRRQGLLGPLPPLQQPVRIQRPGAELGNRDIEGADAGVEIAVTVAVAGVDPLVAAFAVAGAADRVVPIERAFAVFTEDFGAFKPPEHNMLGVEIAETVFEPRVGGYLYDRGVDGSECRWARVLAYEPPHRVLLSWDISPHWQLRPTRRRPASGRPASSPKPRSAPASRLSTAASTATATGWEGVREGVAGDQGWPLYLQRYAERLQEEVR